MAFRSIYTYIYDFAPIKYTLPSNGTSSLRWPLGSRRPTATRSRTQRLVLGEMPMLVGRLFPRRQSSTGPSDPAIPPKLLYTHTGVQAEGPERLYLFGGIERLGEGGVMLVNDIEIVRPSSHDDLLWRDNWR
jgi:hypothetical protein